MDGNHVPTLKDNAMIESALLLYKSEFINIEKFITRKFNFEKHIKIIAKKKISVLDLPVTLEESLVDMATCVFKEIRKRNLVFNAMHDKSWIIFGQECHCLDGILQNLYHFKSNGSADDQKILKALIKNGKIDLLFRFTVACEFNFLRDVTYIWEEMPQAMRHRLSECEISVSVRFWTLMSFKRERLLSEGVNVPLFDFFQLVQRIFRDERYPFFDGLEDDVKAWIRNILF